MSRCRDVKGRIAATLALIYPPGIGIIVPGERYDEAAKPMIDYFLAFEDSCNRFPGFSYEVQGVYQVAENDGSGSTPMSSRNDAAPRPGVNRKPKSLGLSDLLDPAGWHRTPPECVNGGGSGIQTANQINSFSSMNRLYPSGHPCGFHHPDQVRR